MKFNPDAYHRRSIRLPGYDYARHGAYFITICAYNRECLFGEITGGEMRLNECGMIATACWQDISKHFPSIALDIFIIMPNHVHGIVIIQPEGRDIACYVPTEPRPSRFSRLPAHSLPSITRAYKSAVTKRINESRGTPGVPVWQKGYYEHIVRDEKDLNTIREYIRYNPEKWAEDGENPHKAGRQRTG
jgi:putative transposase